MADLKIYQIGVGSFGRYGFEKFVEMHNHLEEVDVELAGVVEKDFEKLEAAEKFAGASGIDLETFTDVEEMYDAAAEEGDDVLIYDAGPSETHARHIYSSLQKGFYHLAEKPPSMTREEHLKEKELARDHDVFWKVDFIERESPVVRKARELLEGETVEEIQVFRESSAGIQKLLQPVERQGVKGGDILDKMVHEIYVLDFLEAAGEEPVLELEDTDTRYFMPKNPGGERLMTVDGAPTRKVSEAATAQTRAEFSSGEADVVLHSSWLGLSEEAREHVSSLREDLGHDLSTKNYMETGDSAFLDEEVRFFLVRGSRELIGDMNARKLYDMDTGEEIELPDLMHDQLYRVIEKAVFDAAEHRSTEVTEKETTEFMEAIFDAIDAVDRNRELFGEIERATEKIRQMIVDIDLDREEEVEA